MKRNLTTIFATLLKSNIHDEIKYENIKIQKKKNKNAKLEKHKNSKIHKCKNTKT